MMTESLFDDSHEAWQLRGERLVGFVLRELMLLDDEAADRVRAEGHVFVNYFQVISDEINRYSMGLVFRPFSDVDRPHSATGAQWLFGFNYVVNMLLEPDDEDCDIDPFEHPGISEFDSLPTEQKRLLLMRYAIDIDPASIVRAEVRHLHYDKWELACPLRRH